MCWHWKVILRLVCGVCYPSFHVCHPSFITFSL